MELENAWYNFITENNIATENEVNLVTDINGNPRYVVHFLAFTTDEEMRNDNLSRSKLYAIAKKRANDLGFSVYRANWYGGGFVGQSYSLLDTANKINEIVKK